MMTAGIEVTKLPIALAKSIDATMQLNFHARPTTGVYQPGHDATGMTTVETIRMSKAVQTSHVTLTTSDVITMYAYRGDGSAMVLMTAVTVRTRGNVVIVHAQKASSDVTIRSAYPAYCFVIITTIVATDRMKSDAQVTLVNQVISNALPVTA